MLIDKIKSAQLEARKSKDTVAVAALTCVIGDASQLGKAESQTDEKVIAVIGKHLKSLNETIQITGSTPDAVYQIEVLEAFMPKRPSDEQLKSIVENSANIGALMKAAREFCVANGLLFDGLQVKQAFSNK